MPFQKSQRSRSFNLWLFIDLSFTIIFSQRCLQEAVMAFKNSPRSILRARSQLRKIRCVHVFLLISSLFHFTFAFLMFCISLYLNKTAAHGMVSLASLLGRYHQIHHQLFDFLMLCLFHFLLLRPPEMILWNIWEWYLQSHEYFQPGCFWQMQI